MRKKAFSTAREVGWEKIYSATDIQDAIRNICSENQNSTTDSAILICGSLYLAGQALRENGVRV